MTSNRSVRGSLADVVKSCNVKYIGVSCIVEVILTHMLPWLLWLHMSRRVGTVVSCQRGNMVRSPGLQEKETP